MKTFSSAKQKVLEFKYFTKVGLLAKLNSKGKECVLCMYFIRPGLCPPPVCILQFGRSDALGEEGSKLIFPQVCSALNFFNNKTRNISKSSCSMLIEVFKVKVYMLLN